MPDDRPAPRRTLRLAVSMRGGVSLAVWIGGAVAEIDALRWDLAQGERAATTMGRIARALDTKAVEIDVISGTSAGGLNGVVLGAAMANGTPIEGLRLVWLRTADLASLMRPGGWKRRRSLLDSDAFLDQARTAICAMRAASEDDDGDGVGDGEGDDPDRLRVPELERLEAYFPVTSVVPATTTAWADPLAPVSERRVGGWIWLHHPVPAPGHQLPNPRVSDFRLPDPMPADVHADRVDALALTICSTAAFPVAFAPTCIPADILRDRVRFPDGLRPSPLYLYDGGVVDNMPVGRAVAAISRAPADGPTERVLIYMHPSPGGDQARRKPLAGLDPSDRPAPIDVGRSALNVLRGKSLVDDLRLLEEHNRAVRWHLRARAAALSAPIPAEGDRNLAAVRETVAAHDAERITSLLCDPTPHLEALGPGGMRDPWLRQADGVTQERWVAALTERIVAEDLALRPWSAFIRTASRLVEWARWLEESPDAADDVSQAKKTIHELRTHALLEASELDRSTLVNLPPHPCSCDDGDVGPDVRKVIDCRVDVLRTRRAQARVDAAWADLVAGALTLLSHHPGDVRWSEPADGLPIALAARLTFSADRRRALQHLDDDLLPIHGHAPTGSLDQVRYHTLAGTAPTPLTGCFPWLEEFRPAHPPLDLSPLADDGGEPDALGRIDPSSKLAGNQLMNFAAFLDVSWRASDWMWGQADAADTVIRLLVDPAHTVPDPVQAARDIRDICLDDGWSTDLPAPWVDELRALAREPWRQGSDDDSDAVVRIATELAGRETRVHTHAVIAWRRHLEVLARELARPRAENPNRVSTVEPQDETFADAVKGWNAPARKLKARWGGRSEAALGASAMFRAVRTLLGRTPRLAWAFGLPIAVLAGPVVGIAMARRRGVAATVIALAGVTLPRTYGDDVGPWLTTALIVGVAALGGWATWGPGPTEHRWRDEMWTVLAGLVALVALVSTIAVTADDDLVTTARRGWFPDGPLADQLPVAVAAAVAATLLVWFWTRWWVRAILVGIIGLLVAFWVWRSGDPTDPGFLAWFEPIEAIAWCLVAIVIVTSLVGFNVPRLGPVASTLPLGPVDPDEVGRCVAHAASPAHRPARPRPAAEVPTG